MVSILRAHPGSLSHDEAQQITQMLALLEHEDQQYFSLPHQSLEQIAARVELPRESFVGENHIFLARTESDSKTVGICWCVIFDPGTGLEGEVAQLYVVPQLRGQGVGTALVAAAVALFEERGVTFASAWTGKGNSSAVSLYKRAGFLPPPQEVLVWYPGKVEAIPAGGAGVQR